MQRECSIRHWMDYVKRTSDHDYLKMSKKKQDKSIDNSRAMPRYKEETKDGTIKHETDIKNLITTVWQIKQQMRYVM